MTDIDTDTDTRTVLPPVGSTDPKVWAAAFCELSRTWQAGGSPGVDPVVLHAWFAAALAEAEQPENPPERES